MTQEELLKALKGSSGRKETNLDLGQVQLRPTIQRGGQYNVQVQQAPQTNPALQLADALKGGSQLLGQFVDIQSKQGEIEANALSPQEVIKRVESGDPEAVSFLDKLGKEKAFVETSYKRYFNSTVQPQLTALAQELQSKPVHEYADQGITTAEDFKVYTDTRVKELTDKFGEYTDKSPYAKVLHNQLIEEVVPDLVQRQVSSFDQNVTKHNRDYTIGNLIPQNADNGISLNPRPASGNVPLNVPNGTVITDFGQRGDLKTGKGKDPYLDTNSAFAIGFKVPEQAQADIKAGKPSVHKMVNGDIGLSPDMRKIVEGEGAQYMDTISVTLDDGTVHTGRWMDVTSTTLTGRVDVYTDKGPNPLRGRKVAQVNVDAQTSSKNRVNRMNSIMEANDQKLAAVKVSPTERAEILRRDSLLQVQTLSTQGKITESRILLESLKEAKVANQALFGSTVGALEYAKMEEAVDREEERLSFENEKTAKKKVEEAVAGPSLRLLNSLPENLENDYKESQAELNDRTDLTDSEKVAGLKELSQLYQNKAAAEYTKATRSDNMLNKLNTEGGSTGAFANFSNSTASDDRISGVIAGSALLREKAVLNDPITGKQVINPAFTQQMRDSITVLGAQKNFLNQTQTEMIERGEGFTYNVNGKSVVFEGTNDPVGKKQLHMRLGEAFQEDLNSSLIKKLETDVQANPLFLSAPSDKPLTKYEQAYQSFIKQGVPVEQAKTLATTESQKGIEPVIVKGQVRINRAFGESPEEYVAAAVTALGDVQVTPEQSEALLNSAVFNGKRGIQENVMSFNKNPLKNLNSLTKLEKAFTDIGIPWESVKSGRINYMAMEHATAFGQTAMSLPAQTLVENYFSIDQYLKRPEATTKYKILPLNVLRNKDTPDVKKAIENVAAKYNMNYNDLVKGQEAWYALRNIKTSK